MGERKISNSAAARMVAVAVLCDLINIGVDLVTFGLGGFVVDFITTCIFAFWFSTYGVSIASSRNVGRTLLAIVLDALPITDMAFPWTWQVAYTAFTERRPAPRQAPPPRPSQFRL